MSKKPMFKHAFYFISDSTITDICAIEQAKEACKNELFAFQYREKGKCIDEMIAGAKGIAAVCRKSKVPFIVNDSLEVALAVDAGGLHIGQTDVEYAIARKHLGNDKIIGVTANSVKDAEKAVALGADYIAAAPIFKTATKKDAGDAKGIAFARGVAEIAKGAGMPVVGIGGITLENAYSVLGAGVFTVCAISASLRDGRIKETVSRFNEIIKSK
ncbi:thiamine phosphate synthase [Candidatus Micrarchaeota archaeon CG08_land_8_20_14_0_20_49_17]|nr:MAG: thiamine phosphate synthase [Candidatus Micrarchaeota archaeon CG08_land_8_20_14_0_20_49_17]HII53277.1 thiamine phosphate synthase [Candidatus Micrarchaeota archaeon]